ncbi:MAG: extracellular solute-binding protein [Ruminococcaceae bacterium]|nr:extracellular solute-binding protein [Oscillospiraceae bacterium]
MVKKVSLIMAVLMVVSMLLMVSCDGDEPKTSGAENTGNDVPETIFGMSDWPERKMEEGTELKVFGRASRKADFVVDGLADDPINDAVYNRNVWLKDTFGFEVTYHSEENDTVALESMTNICKSGVDNFDLFVAGGTVISSLGRENYLLDMKTVENIDLTAEWWDQDANRDLSIANRVFFTSGALNTSAIASVYCVFMNKDVLKKKGDYQDPYQLVRDNEWTIDKLLEISKDYVSDDGNGSWGKEDTYGYIGENYDSYALFFCSGERVVSKNAEDLPELVVDTPRAAEFVKKMKEFYSDNSVYIDLNATLVPMAQENRTLFRGALLNAIKTYRAMDADFGILPLPKYEASQENYGHSISVASTGCLVGIPTCTANSEAAGFMVEMLAKSSLNTLYDAYLESTVKTRGLRDEESYEMLEIITNSLIYDVAYMNSWGTQHRTLGWMYYFYTISGNPSLADNFSSEISKHKDSTIIQINETIDVYKSYLE